VTGETKENTDPWVKEQGQQYPYMYLEKAQISAFMKDLGMRGYPSAVLVDPKGKIAWVGSPYSVNGSLVKKHLRGASKTPVNVNAVTKNWPDSAKAVKAAYGKGQLAKALSAAESLDARTREGVIADLRRAIDRKVAAMKAQDKEGDYFGYLASVAQAGKTMSGLPELAELQTRAKEIKADPEAKKVVKAQKQVDKIAQKVPKMSSRKDYEGAIKKLYKLRDKNDGNYAGKTAVKLVKRLEGKLKKLR
jgi:hypothetical protein